MSYILDALRKADAQRESDPARGIHAQPVRAAIGEQRVQAGYGIGFWAATAAVLAAVAVAGWYLLRDSGSGVPPAARAELAAAPAAATPAAPATPVAAVAPAPSASAIVVASTTPAPEAAPPPAAAVLPPPPIVVSRPVVLAPPIAPKAEAAAAKPAPKAAAARTAASRATPAAAVTAPASAASAAVAAAPVTAQVGAPVSAPAAGTKQADTAPPIAGLPGDAPKLAISGGVYSANAAQRMLIVNGQVFNEGAEIGPGVTLEEIKAKAAVVRFRGSRYTVGF